VKKVLLLGSYMRWRPRLGLYGCIGHTANLRTVVAARNMASCVVGGVRCTVGTLEDRGGGKVSP